MADIEYNATGRRKSSIAQVFIKPGTGNIVVNKKYKLGTILGDIATEGKSTAINTIKYLVYLAFRIILIPPLKNHNKTKNKTNISVTQIVGIK